MPDHFDDLLQEPHETLDVEIKQWLAINEPDDRSTIAKELIALANHGGGYLVFGFEETDSGQFVPYDCPDPAKWSQDTIHDIVARYVDPPFQCRVVNRVSQTGIGHTIVSVPGGHRVPVRAKAGSPDNRKLVVNRIYIRRAGPSSQEPQSSEDWDRLLNRCLQNRKDELLDALRSIMQGELPAAGPVNKTVRDELSEFQVLAERRWQALVGKLPAGSPPQMPNGHFDFAFAIDGGFEKVSLPTLRHLIETEVRNHSGWPPFLSLQRVPFQPHVYDGCIEFWRGPDTDGSVDTPSHHDYWIASPKGMFFTRRGLREDGDIKAGRPGEVFDLTTPVWKTAEALLQAFYISRALGAESSDVEIAVGWSGLEGRALVALDGNRSIRRGRISFQDKIVTGERVLVSAIFEALPELVAKLMNPIYELFDTFTPPAAMYHEEVAKVRNRQF